MQNAVSLYRILQVDPTAEDVVIHAAYRALMIQETARQFAMREVLPIANELDPVQGDIPQSLRDQMAEMGYFGILIPEEHGGLGLGCFEYCLIAEELGRAWMSVASLIARGNQLIGLEAMSKERQALLLPKVASGEMLASSTFDVGATESAMSL